MTQNHLIHSYLEIREFTDSMLLSISIKILSLHAEPDQRTYLKLLLSSTINLVKILRYKQKYTDIHKRYIFENIQIYYFFLISKCALSKDRSQLTGLVGVAYACFSL